MTTTHTAADDDSRDELIESARALASDLDAAEQMLTRMRENRTKVMSQLHEAGLSWAEIGRLFKVTPQAAMYATGHAQRATRATKATSAAK